MEAPGSVGGAAVGLGAAAIKELARKLKAHKAKAFPSPEEYEALQGLKSEEEYRQYKAVVKDKVLLGACLYGMRLSRVQGSKEKVEFLREFIRKRHGGDRLFLAQAVQVGLLLRLIHHLQEAGFPLAEQQRQVAEFLQGIGRHLILVQAIHDLRQLEPRAQFYLALNPLLFCIAGAGVAAPLAKELAERVQGFAYDYEVETIAERNRHTVIFSYRGT
ncbi:MAG: hypothetical protein LC623_02445 [Halobacteriales archaeon]|nr:hypothetical protein [Halobacteriales archaeon]